MTWYLIFNGIMYQIYFILIVFYIYIFLLKLDIDLFLNQKYKKGKHFCILSYQISQERSK